MLPPRFLRLLERKGYLKTKHDESMDAPPSEQKLHHMLKLYICIMYIWSMYTKNMLGTGSMFKDYDTFVK